MLEQSTFSSVVGPDTPISKAITLMSSMPGNKHIAGISIVLDANQAVTGVLTDGDIRRGLAKGIGIDQPVSKVANPAPLTISRTLSPQQMRRYVLDEARRRGTSFLKYDKLILVDEQERFYDVIRLSDIIEPQVDDKVIAIHGLGFVGLTLACTFANAGLSVVGIDTDKSRIDMLKNGVAPFYEKGLDSLLQSLATRNPIYYATQASERAADIHVVTVGSPVDSTGKPNLGHLIEASETISRVLKPGALIIYRSTVPAGTMRQVVLPVLEKSGLFAGDGFSLAFAPERTVEGNALEELRLLPQIVGGFDRVSTQQAANLFRRITHTIIELNSLEEAELVKLMNNTFRDVVFSFANEVASVCEAFNINAFDIIRAANEGYPRDRIPMPSPGVGGVCLSKDPYLYTHPMAKLAAPLQLGVVSRSINSGGIKSVVGKLHQFAAITQQDVSELNILVVGLAFKGMPETSDIRGSITLDLLAAMPNQAKVRIKDFVVSDKAILELGYAAEENELSHACANADAIFFMNNHYRNNKFNVANALKQREKPALFFDGWNMFNQREIEALGNVFYATMGYMTKMNSDS